MLVEIHPIQVFGNWDIGYALDTHVISSTIVGEDPYGNPVFDNIRSEIGSLLYEYKYQQKYENLKSITDTILYFLSQHPEMGMFESIIPVPPTPDNQRIYQPTYEIAKALAERLHVYCCDNILEKQVGIQLKGKTEEEKSKIENFIVKQRNATRKHNVLLIDDLYQTGTTLRFCTQRLKEDPLVEKVYVLTVTKTKNR